jgi:hypothetical protein
VSLPLPGKFDCPSSRALSAMLPPSAIFPLPLLPSPCRLPPFCCALPLPSSLCCLLPCPSLRCHVPPARRQVRSCRQVEARGLYQR